MRLCRADLESVDLERLRPLSPESATFFDKGEHYRLLAHLSERIGARPIVDLGTNYGDSALALSYGGGRVDTFDVEDRVTAARRESRPNIHHHLADVFTDQGRERWRSTLLESALVFIDIDPHEGTRERELLSWLERESYRGIIVLDDIWYFKQMRDRLWYTIHPHQKVDATSLGHWSGTGITWTSAGERVDVEGVDEAERAGADWTLVTGYFDLTKKHDATDELKARPKSHYVETHGTSVLALDRNLVVFCEEETEDRIWSMRPKELHGKTRVITQSFEAFPMSHHRERIIENRSGYGCLRDPRNTASYYLFCMARYAMVKQAIAWNPFGSTHFAWINICIERMGYRNLIHLPEALSLKREKFSTCFIDYVSKAQTEDLAGYFGADGCNAKWKTCAAACSMCSGFFTGGKDAMRQVCTQIEQAFVRCLVLGYGHADEQLFPIVYHESPELFEWYVGDYTEMITNYASVYEHPEKPIRNLIAHAIEHGDKDVAKRACELVWNAFAAGHCQLEDGDRRSLLGAWEKASS